MTNKEAIQLIKEQPAGPVLKEPCCADCGRSVRKAWHIPCKTLWRKQEILLCVECGKKHGLDDRTN